MDKEYITKDIKVKKIPPAEDTDDTTYQIEVPYLMVNDLGYRGSRVFMDTIYYSREFLKASGLTVTKRTKEAVEIERVRKLAIYKIT